MYLSMKLYMLAKKYSGQLDCKLHVKIVLMLFTKGIYFLIMMVYNIIWQNMEGLNA